MMRSKSAVSCERGFAVSTPTNLNPTWDLDQIFPGGSDSPEFARYLSELEREIRGFRIRAEEAAVPGTVPEALAWSDLLVTLQEIARRLRQAGAFVSCLTAQDVTDRRAKVLAGRISQLGAAFGGAGVRIDHQMLAMADGVWQGLLADPRWSEVAGPLDERRGRAREKLPPELEALAGDLAVDGYHGWQRMYDTIVGRIQIPFEEDGRAVHLSVGQTFNRLHHPEKAVRAEAWAKYEAAWAKEADLAAAVLNHLGGFRINLYRQRGWDSVLREPLENNRMSAETLAAMWEAIERRKGTFVKFLARKSQLLGVERLGWEDVSAPLPGETGRLSYSEAAGFIVEHFRRFSPRMADFAEKAFTQRWIEAENRPGKGPGGFCTNFPESGQSRIFLTFSGGMNNVATLAHELGHAWHQHLMNGLPYLAQGYAMNVAETASTFAEMLVADAAVKAAASAEERQALVLKKAERGVSFFMNIHARFLFETAFYAEREQGMLTVERLNSLMVDAQRRAYCDALATYDPHFWANKLHFYRTGQPFYNFPYTFGFLFSYAVYARAQAEGPSFEPAYAALLQDTGRMRVEDLARRHLGVDLRTPEFWESVVALSEADVEEFLRLSEGEG